MVAVTGVLWTLGSAPASAQVVSTDPPTTRPPTTLPPTTQPPPPPVTEPATTAVTAPPTTRPRVSTTRSATSTSIATTTTHTLLPPPSVAPQDPQASPVGSEQSDHLSGVFVVLSILGFVTGIGLLGSQWYLTRPGRQGWTI